MNKLLYLGHASLRIITREGKVIYIDPFAGDNYELDADLVLITHDHYDHTDLSKIKNNDYKLITYKEALEGGVHNSFNLDYVKIKSVEAGYNKYHDVTQCVGYVLTLSNSIKIYIAGDTYLTPEMYNLANDNIDYAFYPCDGVYTMNIEEAKEASERVQAKHNIPYHMVPGGGFSEETVNNFAAENKLIIKPGEEIEL